MIPTSYFHLYSGFFQSKYQGEHLPETEKHFCESRKTTLPTMKKNTHLDHYAIVLHPLVCLKA